MTHRVYKNEEIELKCRDRDLPAMHLIDQSNAEMRLGAARTWARQFIAIFCFTIALTFISFGFASEEESRPALKSGPDLGSEVTSFYVRAVTGPHAGKSVCYVCRNGDRPVVMVILRELGSDTTRLLKQLDLCVNENRANGLRCFVVLLSDSSQKDGALLQTLAFDEKIELPLTLAGEAATGTSLGQISNEAAVTAILYDDLTVKERFSYRRGECDQSACQSVITATKNLVKNSAQ